MSGPERMNYVEIRTFKSWCLVDTEKREFRQSESLPKFWEIVDKYKSQVKKTSILICLRDREHNLIKSELVK